MDVSLVSTSIVALLIAGLAILQRLRTRSSETRRDAEAEKPRTLDLTESFSEPALKLKAKLEKVLPGRVVGTEDEDAFKRLVNSH